MSRISAFSRHAALVLFGLLLMAAPTQAQNAKRYLVLPFEYTGPAKYQYYSKALQADLSSKLEWTGHFQPENQIDTTNVKIPNNEAEAIQLAKNLSVDYVAWGSTTILDKTATMKLSIQGVGGKKWSNKGQIPMTGITNWMRKSADAIMGDVFQRPGYGQTAEQKLEAQQQGNSGPKGPNFLSANSNNPSNNYGVKTLNPQFRYEGGVNTPGRWRSQTLRYPSFNMVVCDGDGDGKNEVFIMAEHNIHAYRFSEGKLLPLESFKLVRRFEPLRLSHLDVNGDGAEDLIVCGYQDERPVSHILSFKGGKYEKLVDSFTKFLGALKTPPTYRPMLVAQKLGRREFFDEYMYEAYYKDGEVKLANKIPTPAFGNIFNICYLPDGDSYKICLINDFRRLLTFTPTLERQAETQESYNTSPIMVEFEDVPLGMGGSPTKGIDSYIYIPIRMTAANLTQKDKFELLVNKDITLAGVVFDRFHQFAQGEIHSLVWDGVGMNLAWKTRRIKGTVTDYDVVDLNNDGKKQLAVLVNTYPGNLGVKARKTIVVTYELDM
ncbi:FG-GAP repeat domain-containing protein [Pseudodesulfovibrio senegalensis]|jgi:hypothetical protein|uniref:VCBS repeat-containing protein n=1 Tax=Pseudodesulfovibrio senegalensis TaxID=1721087 RepID=A0A6N6N2R7_9BACT|nr:VCBS repeat-containing protein [Pseudodesulfovibrio senegalensis]KAB1441332.1 VCBS repeat-containing protein [Pseudodesulfovibrio senegalensis]